MEEEEAHLREDLLAHESGIYNEQTATAGASRRAPRSCWDCMPAAACRPGTLWSPARRHRDHDQPRARISCPPAPRARPPLRAEAKGVVASRLQNVVITLDKCKRFLAEPAQVVGRGRVASVWWLESGRVRGSGAARGRQPSYLQC